MGHELDHLTEQVIGAAIEVHRHLGPGFQESTYHRALCIELDIRGIRYQCEVPVQLEYKDTAIGKGRIDQLVEDQLVVELKATEHNPKKYLRQVVAYLKAADLSLGLVINFESDVLHEGVSRVIL